jgi:hypothetical protein
MVSKLSNIVNVGQGRLLRSTYDYATGIAAFQNS